MYSLINIVNNVAQQCQCVSQFGRVDLLINNAGIVSGKKIMENNEKMIEKTIWVNIVSHHYTYSKTFFA